MAYDRKTTVGEILADPIAVEVLEDFIPGIATHPMIHHALTMTLEDVASFPPSGADSEMIDDFLDAINERLQG